MTLVIITHVPHIVKDCNYYAYAPYIREINIWCKFADKVIIVAPVEETEINPIHDNYTHHNIEFLRVPSFNLLSLQSIMQMLYNLPKIVSIVYKGMNKASHIHLRCPGNMGLIGAFVQTLFPNKPKTAKYAGNWDSNSIQPWSYKLQKQILNNSIFSKKMQVLVYGSWKKSSKNIKSFFTATYYESEKLALPEKVIHHVTNFLFVGALSKGKNPMYAIELIETLHKDGLYVTLDLYGEGEEKATLENYISYNKLDKIITLKGNQNRENIKKAFQDNHFVILPSESEGWPKAIAEGMFWGCVPIATSVSCLSWMLDHGNRGILLSRDLKKDTAQIMQVLTDREKYISMQKLSSEWSRKFTLDVFESEIKKLLEQ